MSKPFSLDELVEIFWQSDAAEVLAHQWSIARVYARRSVSLFSITDRPIQSDKIDLPMPEQIDFFLMGQPFGDTLYVAVMCDKHVIVPPFSIHDRSSIPSMYRKESKLASRPGTPRLDL